MHQACTTPTFMQNLQLAILSDSFNSASFSFLSASLKRKSSFVFSKRK